MKKCFYVWLLCAFFLISIPLSARIETADGRNPETLPTEEVCTEQEEVRMLCREWLNLILPDGTSFGSLDGGNTTTVSFENTLIHIDRNYKGEISSIRYSCSEYDESTSAEHLSNTEKLERFKVRLDELPVFQREDLLSDGGNPLLYGFCIPYPAVGGRNDDQLKWQWQLLSIKPGGEMLLDNKLVLITWDPLLDRITGISFQRLDF